MRQDTHSHDERPDAGFTLIEVIVSVVLLVLIMPSVSLFFVSSIKTSAALQRRDAATQLADEAMELVRAVPITSPSGGVSPLLRGRSQATVEAQWLTAPAELGTTTPVWDTAPAGSPVIPLRVTKRIGQQTYDIDTFIGACEQRAADTVCSNAVTTGATFYRVVVRVAWAPGAGASCSGQVCEFLLTTVLSSDSEPLFNTSVDAVRPVARADFASVIPGSPVTLSLLGNDTGSFAVNPVTVLGTGPASGTLTGTLASGTMTYTSTMMFEGTDTFSYLVTDSGGLTSDPATVTVTVTRPPAPTASSVTVCAVRQNPTSVSIRLADHVTAHLPGGTFTRLSGPAPANWQTPTGPAAGDTSGSMSVRSIGRPPTTTYPISWQFRDAWSRTVSGTYTIQIKATCP